MLTMINSNYKKCQFYNFLKVSKNVNFTKIQQEIQKKLVIDIGNRYYQCQCFTVASKGHISVVDSWTNPDEHKGLNIS